MNTGIVRITNNSLESMHAAMVQVDGGRVIELGDSAHFRQAFDAG